MSEALEWAAIIQSANEITDRLAAVGSSISRNDLEGARSNLEALSAAHSRKRTMEQARVAQVRTAREDSDLDWDARVELSETIQKAMRTSAHRAEFYGTVQAYLEAPDEVDEYAVQESIDRTIEAEDQLATAESSTSRIVEEVPLPATITIVSVAGPTEDIDPGDSFTIEAAVRNVGDQEASEVELGLEPVEGVSYEYADAAVGTLEGGSERRVAFEGVPDTPGNYSVTVLADSENAGADERIVPLSAVYEGFVEQVGLAPLAIGAGAVGLGGITTVGGAAYWFLNRRGGESSIDSSGSSAGAAAVERGDETIAQTSPAGDPDSGVDTDEDSERQSQEDAGDSTSTIPFCPHCGADLEDTGTVCPECGEGLAGV